MNALLLGNAQGDDRTAYRLTTPTASVPPIAPTPSAPLPPSTSAKSPRSTPTASVPPIAPTPSASLPQSISAKSPVVASAGGPRAGYYSCHDDTNGFYVNSLQIETDGTYHAGVASGAGSTWAPVLGQRRWPRHLRGRLLLLGRHPSPSLRRDLPVTDSGRQAWHDLGHPGTRARQRLSGRSDHFGLRPGLLALLPRLTFLRTSCTGCGCDESRTPQR